MAEIPLDVCEQILVRSDVEDLIRWKRVCKSWESLITSPRFVEAHLKHSCKNDRDNHELGHRRITSYSDAHTLSWFFSSFFFYADNCNSSFIVGSCNGLVCVCVSSRYVDLVVINPSTREEKKLQTPYLQGIDVANPLGLDLECWGFGYDAVTDDYKVILGFLCEEGTRFHVLTLRSNSWRVIGEANYDPHKAKSGVLCGGALHWLMRDEYETEEILVSLDLSTEELKEIPQPIDQKGYLYDKNHTLGVIEECLCIYSYDLESFCDSGEKKWVMRNKWELYNDGNCESKYDVIHHLNLNPFCRYEKNYEKWVMRNNKLLSGASFLEGDYCEGKYDDDVYSCDEGKRTSNTHGYYLGASIFVKSLVSPHPRVNGTPTRNSKQGQEGNGIVQKGSIRKWKSKNKRKRSCKHKKPRIFNFKSLVFNGLL